MKKRDKKTIDQKELEKYFEWYKPSNSENVLMSRILSELRGILVSKGVNGNIKWTSQKAFVRIPYGLMAKAECIAQQKTISVPIQVTKIDDENEIVLVSFTIDKKTIEKKIAMKFAGHGFVDHNYRTYSPKVEITSPREIKEKPSFPKFKPITPHEYKKNAPIQEPSMFLGCDCDCD